MRIFESPANSFNLRACAIDSHVTVPVRTQRGKFKIAMLFQVHEYKWPRAARRKNCYVISSTRIEMAARSAAENLLCYFKYKNRNELA